MNRRKELGVLVTLNKNHQILFIYIFFGKVLLLKKTRTKTKKIVRFIYLKFVFFVRLYFSGYINKLTTIYSLLVNEK